MVSGNLRDACSVCEAWYQAEPSLVTFTLRGIFLDLVGRGWDDPQGVPTATYQPFQNGVLPHLIRITDTLSASPAAEPIDDLDALTVAYRDSLLATP
jgi:hypothetical protein